jgi:hypothetical protein
MRNKELVRRTPSEKVEPINFTWCFKISRPVFVAVKDYKHQDT